MKLLLDTHILLWSLSGSEKLPARIKNALEEKSNDLWLSPITTWEVLMLCEKGRIRVDHKDSIKWIKEILKTLPFREAPLNHEVAIRSRQVDLPHQDPADRFLVATALVYNLKLLTVDQKILDNDPHKLCF
ncbi:MAG: type II toxin-antitoxin system VapC family toxin [Desulfobacteraceae bacterium]|nr:type II toxin-antitoxin system VapC family toxin [Desulfobacteraceae bacterium]